MALTQAEPEAAGQLVFQEVQPECVMTIRFLDDGQVDLQGKKDVIYSLEQMTLIWFRLQRVFPAWLEKLKE